MNIDKIYDLVKSSPVEKLYNSNILSVQDKKLLTEIKDIIQTNRINMNKTLKIVVLGEVKAGKSTFINSLVGKRVSYTDVLEATSNIIEIYYNKESNIVINTIQNTQYKVKSINELENKISEIEEKIKGNDAIKSIKIGINSEIMKSLEIVDTPGLNTITSKNEVKTEQYILNADIIFWVLNANHLGQRDVNEKLDEIVDYGKQIIGIINRIDEIDADPTELIEYVKDELGYIFKEVYAISAKNAWDGIVYNNSKKIALSRISVIEDYLSNKIKNNIDYVQMQINENSTKVQINRLLLIYKKIIKNIDEVCNNYYSEKNRFHSFNEGIKEMVNIKLNQWIENEFFEEEKNYLLTCSEDDFITNTKRYSTNKYINDLINDTYNKLCKYIFNEWKNNSQKYIEQKADNISINMNSLISIPSKYDKDDIIQGAKKGGITAGVIGVSFVGLSTIFGATMQSATLIGSIPQLLVVGAIGGAIFNSQNEAKKKEARFRSLNQFIEEIRMLIKNNVMNLLIEKLYKTSDSYYKSSLEMADILLKESNISIVEIEKIKNYLIENIRAIEYEMKESVNTMTNSINKYSRNVLVIINDINLAYSSMNSKDYIAALSHLRRASERYVNEVIKGKIKNDSSLTNAKMYEKLKLLSTSNLMEPNQLEILNEIREDGNEAVHSAIASERNTKRLVESFKNYFYRWADNS